MDLKRQNLWTNVDGLRSIRSYVDNNATGTTIIVTTLYILAERRKIHVDHGAYARYLECINCKQQKGRIYDARILDVDNNSIQFLLNIESKKSDQFTGKQVEVVRIVRSKLDSIMYKQQ